MWKILRSLHIFPVSVSFLRELCFKIVIEKDRTGPQVKVLNRGKANFGGIRQELRV